MSAKGSVFKFHTCPDCNKSRREKNPAKKAPPCKKCNSTRAYYSDSWAIAYSIPGQGDKVEVVSPQKSFAETRLTERNSEMEEGSFLPFQQGLAWAEAKTLLLAHKEKTCQRADTYRYYKEKISTIDKYIERFIKNMDELDTDTLIEIRAFRKDQVSPNTINKETAALLHFRTLLSDGSILRVVDGKKIPWLKMKPLAKKLEILEEIPPPEQVWEPNEIETLLAGTDDTYLRCYILMACLGGLRKRTIRDFRREWLNEEMVRLEIPPAGRKRGKKKIHKVSLAGNAGNALLLALQDVWAGYRPYDFESKKFYKEHKDGYYTKAPRDTPYTKGFLFCHPNDPEQQWRGFESMWRKLKAKIGIAKRFHDLKHTAGTYFHLANKDVKATMDFLDQTTYKVMSRYLHGIDEERDKEMIQFQSVFQGRMLKQEIAQIACEKKITDLWPQQKLP